MKPLLFFLFLANSLLAEEADHQTLLDLLFETRDPALFEATFKQAAESGVSQQALIETRFVYLVDTANRSKLGAYAKELEDFLPKFKISESVIFSVPEDYEAIIQYTKALAALEKGDQTNFKEHIKQAFWLSPSQAPVFAKDIDSIRLRSVMSQLEFDFQRKISSQTDEAKPKPLGEYLGESPAFFLQFWSPWSEESLNSMPDFFNTAAALKKLNIPTAAILLASKEESRQEADQFITEQKQADLLHWLLDTREDSLASLLRLEIFPTAILISKEGKILYHGYPDTPNFQDEINKLTPPPQTTE